MNVLDTLLHITEYTMALYAAYVVLGSMAFGIFIWRRVYAVPAPVERVQVERRMRPRLHDSDSNAH